MGVGNLYTYLSLKIMSSVSDWDIGSKRICQPDLLWLLKLQYLHNKLWYWGYPILKLKALYKGIPNMGKTIEGSGLEDF